MLNLTFIKEVKFNDLRTIPVKITKKLIILWALFATFKFLGIIGKMSQLPRPNNKENRGRGWGGLF